MTTHAQGSVDQLPLDRTLACVTHCRRAKPVSLTKAGASVKSFVQENGRRKA